MKDSFGRRMFLRSNDAYKRVEEVDRVVRQAVPVLQEAVTGNKKQIEALTAVLGAMKTYQDIFDASAGHLAELDTASLKHEVAHLTTFLNAMDVYFAAEPETVKSALEKFDLEILEAQLVGLPKSRFNELYDRMERAKSKRSKG